MPSQSFAFEKDGPKRLHLSWGGLWKNFTVRLDDQVVGSLPGYAALLEGQDFSLPDGSKLHVQLVRKFSASELQVLRDGKPLPGSASAPETRLRSAWIILYFLGGLNLVLGAAGTVFPDSFIAVAGGGLFSLIYGAAFILLAVLVQRRVYVALLVAVVVFGLDTLLGFVFSLQQGTTPSVVNLLVRVLLLIPMAGGLRAIRELEQAGD